jgi:anaerobic magnesium-protoporphyrin IX monomethyl ester cyclase
MHATLLFAPGTDPRSPHLALPSLTAFLRAGGARVTQRDADLEGFLSLLEPLHMAEVVVACQQQFDRAAETERPRLRDLLGQADAVLEDIGAAPARLRDPRHFYDPFAHHAARRCIRSALEIVSAASGGVVDYGIEPPHYDVRDVDVMRLADLASATAEASTNLFEAYYQSAVLPDLDRDRPDLVAVSILNLQQVIPGLTLARRLKERGHFVVIGGTVYTKFVGELLQRPRFFELFCDGLIAYEGETALLELLAQLTRGRDFGQVPNFLYLDRNGRVTFTRYHVEDVNALPTPDFDGLPLDNYLAPSPVLPILTGKGCYFNRCKFCDIPFINHISKKAYRVRTAERVARDVAALHQRYGARHFEITDEALAPKLLLRLADALDDYPALQPRFVGYARLEPGFTPEVCRRVYEMGMRKLFFGLESGSQATLDHMDKGIRVDEAQVVLRNCADAGLAFHLFSIIGFPEETEDRARETAQFFVDNARVIDHPRNTFDIHPFSLDLRTDYADRSVAYGIEIDAEDLGGRDFPLTAVHWRNARGLDQPSVERLLDEFHAQLRATYHTYHQYPLFLWPGYEEYTLLYGDYYEQRPFTVRICLPPAGDETPVRLVWTAEARIEPVDGGYVVSGPFGQVGVGQNALALLARPTQLECVDDLLPGLAAPLLGHARPTADVLAELRTVIDWLLGTGALRIADLAAEPVAQ